LQHSLPIADWVTLSRLRLQAVIGVYPHERLHPQPIDLDLALQVDTREAATTLDLTRSIDYAKVARDVRLLIQNGRFHLLETAAEAVAAFLLAPCSDRARPESVRVTLHKPSALDGLATPSVAIHRKREDFQYGEDIAIFSSADVRISLVEAFFEASPEGRKDESQPGAILIPLADDGEIPTRWLSILRRGDQDFLTRPTQVFGSTNPVTTQM
jgi:FolB domain-containing protein